MAITAAMVKELREMTGAGKNFIRREKQQFGKHWQKM